MKKNTTKKVFKYLTKKDTNTIAKSLVTAIRSCTKLLEKKETLLLIDGTDAKSDIKRLRSLLQSANEKFKWNIEIKIK